MLVSSISFVIVKMLSANAQGFFLMFLFDLSFDFWGWGGGKRRDNVTKGSNCLLLLHM